MFVSAFTEFCARRPANVRVRANANRVANTNNNNRRYWGSADRAFLYKIMQEIFKKNTAQLASDIIDGKVSRGSDARPPKHANDIETYYKKRNVLGIPRPLPINYRYQQKMVE